MRRRSRKKENFKSYESALLDGAAEYVDCTSVLTGSLSATTTGTISCWVKPVDATPTGTERIICFGDANVLELIAITISADSKVYGLGYDAGASQWSVNTDAAAFADNTWVHICLVQDGTSAAPEIFVDSIKVAQTNSTSTDNSKWFAALTGLDTGRLGDGNLNSAGEAAHFNGNLKDCSFWNAALSQAEVSELYNNGAKLDYKKHSKASNLVTWYKMDNTAFAWNKYSYLLDGSDEYVNIDSVLTGGTNVASDTKGCISAWIRPVDSTPAAADVPITFGDTDANEFIVLQINTSGTLSAICRDAGTLQWKVDTDVAAFADNTWTHIAVTQDGTTAAPILYIDSVLVAQTNSDSTLNSAWFAALTGLDLGRIGCFNANSGGNSNFVNSNLTELAIFNDDLDQTEITELYNAGVPFNVLNHSKTANLVSYFPMSTDTISWNRYSYLLDGTADYINIDPILTSGVELDTKGTISAWVRIVDTSSINQYIISFGDTNANERLVFLMGAAGKIQALCVDAGTNQWNHSTDNVVVTDNTWHMVTLTQDATATLIYVDGTLQDTTFSVTTNKTKWFSALTGLDNGRVGCLNYNSAGNSSFGNLNVTEVCLFNDDLSAAEITELYNSGAPFDAETHSKTANLVAYYPTLNDTFSTNWTVVDEKSGLNGTTASIAEAGREAGVSPVITITDEKNGNDGTSVNVEFEDRVAGVDPTVTIYDEMGNNDATSVNLEVTKMEVDNPY